MADPRRVQKSKPRVRKNGRPKKRKPEEIPKFLLGVLDPPPPAKESVLRAEEGRSIRHAIQTAQDDGLEFVEFGGRIYKVPPVALPTPWEWSDLK